MTVTEKVAPSFPGPLMPTRTDSWHSRSGDLGTKLSNCQIGSDFCAIWHFITSTTHIICFWNPLKPPWNLSPFFATSQLFKPSKFQQVFPDIFSCCSWTKKVEGSRWRRRTGQRGWRQYTGAGIQGDKGAKVELLSRTLVQCPGSMMLMVMEWLVRLRWSISPRWWEGSSFHWHMYVQDRRSQCWTNLDITQVLTEPIVAGRLYGGMMERVADEVRS